MSHPLATALTALPSLAAAHADLRAACDVLVDYASALDRARRPQDPLGTDPAFEGVRQRQRALARTAGEIQEKLDYLAATITNITDDLARLEPGT
jgi:hypothetical protein